MSTIGVREVAAHAGVSPGTVSNVLNRPDKVAPATRERVNAAIRELGFVRHATASTLRAGHSRVIGLSVIDFASASAVSLSSIRQPTYQLGRRAAELLLNEFSDPGGHAHQQIMFQPELVVRESTR